jgi:hypothetical protein
VADEVVLVTADKRIAAPGRAAPARPVIGRFSGFREDGG